MDDYERLTWAATVDSKNPYDRPTATMFANELRRTTIRTTEAIPSSVTIMRSRLECLEFRNEITWEIRCATLLYPSGFAGMAERISILTPIDAARTGLHERPSITWWTPRDGAA